MIFVDTSALLAFLDADDVQNTRAVESFERLVLSGDPVSHNYVVLESAALVHRRGGSDLTRRFMLDLVPLLDLVWVDERLHERAARDWLAGLSRGSSLVDYVSFEVMRERGIDEAFAFDRDFARAGFATLP